MKIMRKLFAFVCAVACLAACGKSAQPGEDGPEGGGDVDRSVTSINLRSSLLEMDLSWSEGVVLDGIVCDPEDTPLSSLRCTSSDEGVVTVEKDTYGFRLFPHKVGEATLTIIPSAGPASATCKVKVNEDGTTSATPISGIQLTTSESMSVVSDYSNRTALFTATFTPGGVSTNDITIYSDRPDLIEKYEYIGTQKEGAYYTVDDQAAGTGSLMVGVTIKKNTAHAPTETGLVNIYIKPKRGTAATQTFKMDVRGHIYKLEFPALATDSDHIKGGEVYLSKGESVKLEPKIYTTGKLLDSDGLYWTSLDVAGLTVGEDWVMTLTDKSGGTMYNNGISVYCGDKSDAMPQRFAIKVHTYEKATGISFSGISASANYYAGETVTFTASVTPSTARQDLKVTSDGGRYVELTRGTGSNINRFTAKFNYGSKSKVMLSLSPVSGGTGGSVSLNVYDYRPTDVKAGDYVYYNSSNGFWTSDGGLRVYGHDEVLDSPQNPTAGGASSLVGIVYDREVDPAYFPFTLSGDNKQRHFAVVGLWNTPATLWCESNDDYKDIAAEWDKSSKDYGSAPVRSGSANASQVYKWNLGWALYNQARGSSHDIKALEAVETFAKAHVIRTMNALGSGSSGWILMGSSDAKAIYDGLDILKTRLSRASADALSQSWTCEYNPQNNKNAVLLDVSKGVGEELRGTKQYIRPIFYL